jgi:hypothetical protein
LLNNFEFMYQHIIFAIILITKVVNFIVG